MAILAASVSEQADREAPGVGSRSNLAAYAACAWALLFAAPSFYWAAGGTGGLASTVSPELVRLADERVPWFVAVLWITGALKVFAGLVALALVGEWGRAFPGGLLLVLV